MKRTLLFVTSATIALLALVFISAALASSGRMPTLQVPSENEPNDDFDQANEMDVPGSIRGSAVNSVTDTDFFVMELEIGRDYNAKLTIDSPQGLKLEMALYDGNQDTVDTSSSSSSETSLSSWTAYTDTYYIQVAGVVLTETLQTATYRLQVNRLAEEPPTSTPTETPLPTNTPLPSSDEDDYEPNDAFDQAFELPIQMPIELDNLTFHVASDKDWFKFWAKDGNFYQATTSDLNLVDTYLKIYDENQSEKAKNDDGGGGFASEVEWEAKYDGYYYIYVKNNVDSTGNYDLTVDEISEPATATPGPSPTPGPGIDPKADSCENNLDFERACVIPVDESKMFNFVPPYHNGPDNDFFKIWVKPGLHFTCETSDLSPGVDPNMIMYNGPSDDQGIAGNDDIEPGNYNSRLTYYATYAGWLYILVGTGDRTPSDIYDSNYTLRCAKEAPGQPTPTKTPQAEPTPDPATPTPTTSASPVATPTPEQPQELTIRPLATPAPTPAASPTPRFVPISLLVYYDANNDQQPGAGEGIAGVSAQAYEVSTNQSLAQGFTDAQGQAEFSVKAQGPVRVSIPFLGFSQLVTGEGASIYVRVPPYALPEGTP